MLQPIHDGNVGEALAILSRGFPSRSALFWRAGLERQAQYHKAADVGPLGYLMQDAGRDVGVILTMRSRRIEADGRERTVLNLSSWFVEESHRWLAPRMLQKVLAEKVDLFTDLTPSPPVQHMIGRLGFTPWNEGVLLAVLPVSALQPAGGATVKAIETVEGAAIGTPLRALIDDHVRWGCIAAVLVDESGVQPIIFARTRRKHLPSARLVFAPSKAAVRRNIGAVARFLMTKGMMLLEVPANRSEEAFGAWFTTRPPPTFARGGIEGDMIDHAYSEFVFLRI
jgi:hypothetical protein